jgi:hypothetical protein
MINYSHSKKVLCMKLLNDKLSLNDLKKKNHQKMSNLHIDMKKSQSFDHSQKMSNLYTDIKKSQSFNRQSFYLFRTSQSYQSAILLTKLFLLLRKQTLLFKLIKLLNNLSNN